MVSEYGSKMSRNPLRKAADKLKDMDAAVQNRMRDLYGLNEEGPISKGKGVLDFIHPKDPTMSGYVMSRGIQAGGLTAAGYGLMKLTEQFGGAADQQEPGQLRLSDLPASQQSLIKGNPAENIVAGMKGYGEFAGLPEKDLKRMLAAVQNEEFYQ